MTNMGILVVPIGSDIASWKELPQSFDHCHPDGGRRAVLVDLAALRPVAERLLQATAATSHEATRALLFGFDAIVVLPGSAQATWQLTGFPPPYTHPVAHGSIGASWKRTSVHVA